MNWKVITIKAILSLVYMHSQGLILFSLFGCFRRLTLSICCGAYRLKSKFYPIQWVAWLYICSGQSQLYICIIIGGGFYIFIEKSKLAQGDQSAQLLSPLIRGPKCLRFYYYMNGSDIGNLDVLLWPRRHQDNYLIWRESGQQGDEWVKASVDVGYTGESQVGRD